MNIDDKTIVKDYFNATGFERWRRIYGEEEVSKVQQDIRDGHQQTIDLVLGWLKNEAPGLTVCDAGCGVGSLSIPLAQRGAIVAASDISEKMIEEAKAKAQAVLGDNSNLTFTVQDLEALKGKYHTVICLDVLIHYPDRELSKMIAHLASLAESRLILSFAPKNLYYSLFKKVGEMFPGPSKTTRAYLHSVPDVKEILKANGLTVNRREMVNTSFYFARLLEAVRV